MSADDPRFYDTVWGEDESKYVLARITRKNSSHSMIAITSTDITSISRAAYSVPSSTTIIASATLTTTDVVITTSTGNIWTKDGTGFNFIDVAPSSAFSKSDEVVQLEYKFVYVDGVTHYLRARGPVLPVNMS